MRLFSETRIEDMFAQKNKEINDFVNFIDENQLLNSDPNSLAHEHSHRFSIKTDLDISTNDVKSSVKMVNVPVEFLTPQQRMFAIKSHYSSAAVDYTFAISGNIYLLGLRPQTFINWSIDAQVNQASITLTVQTQYANVDLSEQIEGDVAKTIQEYIAKINQQLTFIRQECDHYNNGIVSLLNTSFEKRKNDIKNRNERNKRVNPFN